MILEMEHTYSRQLRFLHRVACVNPSRLVLFKLSQGRARKLLYSIAVQCANVQRFLASIQLQRIAKIAIATVAFPALRFKPKLSPAMYSLRARLVLRVYSECMFTSIRFYCIPE